MASRFRTTYDGKRRKVAGQHNGVDYYLVHGTDSCSGCTETEDGHLVGRYSRDARGVVVGSGCDECGYTGKRRWSWWCAFTKDDERVLYEIDERPTEGAPR